MRTIESRLTIFTDSLQLLIVRKILIFFLVLGDVSGLPEWAQFAPLMILERRSQ
jgi:hypothetical protein